MIIDDQIRGEKLQSDYQTEAVQISEKISSCKVDKHEYLTGKEILPSNHSRIIEQAQLTYCPLGKAFEKQIKII